MKNPAVMITVERLHIMLRKGIFLLMLLLLTMLSGCGSQTGIYKQYVKGNLDVIYHNEYKDYTVTMKVSSEEAELLHEQSIKNYADNFAEHLSLEISTVEERERLEAIVSKICDKAKYEVEPAKREKGDYYVTVHVYPMDYQVNATNSCRELMEEMEKEYSEKGVINEEEYKSEYTRRAMDIMERLIDGIGYQEEEEIRLKICLNKDSYYIEDEDFLTVTDYIFQAPIQ